MSKKIWKVTAEPIGRVWHIQVQGLGGATQARSAKEIGAMAKDFIEAKTGTSAKSFQIEMSIKLPEFVAQILERAEQLRNESDKARAEAATESRRAAKALRDEGLTVRDIGATLGISFQRAQQLINN